MSIKISELEECSGIELDACLPVVSNGITKKVTFKKIKEQIKNDISESDPTVPTCVKNITSTDITNWNSKTSFSGNYEDLKNKPYIPDVSEKEDSTNKVTTISANSTDEQYPSAKCVYDLIGNFEDRMNDLIEGEGI